MKKIIKKLIPTKYRRQVLKPYHLGQAVRANISEGFPGKKIKVIGVTGTDGKTTTVSLIASLLRQSGKKVGLITTVNTDFADGKGLQPNTTRMTNLPAAQLFQLIRKIVDNDAEYLVLETTSHALDQYRVWGVRYQLAVLTNLTHEHLDYHGTFEAYRNAKAKLFRLTNRNKAGLRTGVINAEDPNAKYFTKTVSHPLTYGLKTGDLKVTNLQASAEGSQFTAQYKPTGESYNVKLHLPGSFNVSNALAAIGAGIALGLSKTEIEAGIDALKSVEGRMTRIKAGQPFTVIVDFAHTPDSFERVMSDLKPLVKGRMFAVFGCPGERDKAKRPMQGKIAANYCEYVVLTEDDPRSEDNDAIMEQIAEGARAGGMKDGKDLLIIPDRTTAIQTAMNMAKAGDAVLLLSKGHEKTIALADGKSKPFDDVATAKTTIAKRTPA